MDTRIIRNFMVGMLPRESRLSHDVVLRTAPETTNKADVSVAYRTKADAPEINYSTRVPQDSDEKYVAKKLVGVIHMWTESGDIE